MKYLKYIIIILILIFNINVHALCDSKEFSRLKEKAKEIQLIYELVEDVDNNGNYHGSFNITANNLDPELKALIIKNYYLDDYKEFEYNANKEFTLKNFQPGERVTVTFKGYVKNECSGETVYTKSIVLPYYNYFYQTDECKNNRDFEFCKDILINKNIGSDEFYNKYYNYIEQKEKNIDNFITLEDVNYLILLGFLTMFLIIPVFLIIVCSIVKKKRRDSLSL